jgi:hypothetical protein
MSVAMDAALTLMAEREALRRQRPLELKPVGALAGFDSAAIAFTGSPVPAAPPPGFMRFHFRTPLRVSSDCNQKS